MARNEATTKQHLISPKLQSAGWGVHAWQLELEYGITAGRIQWDGKTSSRAPTLRADYLLRYRPSVAIAVVEAKAEGEHHLEGSQQAKDYAKKLGLWFAYSTNGHQIEFFDLKAGTQRTVENFHSPDELWAMYLSYSVLSPDEGKLSALTHDFYIEQQIGQRRSPRYYQELAVRSAIESILKGQKRVLVTQATGTGKTFTSIQIVYKLFKTKVARRILFIVDRNLLADQAYNDFNSAMEKDACYRLSPSDTRFPTSRSVYFGIYQTLVGEDDDGSQTGRANRYEEFPPDFFDLIVIDEAHRGGANTTGNWFRLLNYFNSAIQVGLTATPRRDESVNTYDYFGTPVVNYSLRDGIEDGYLSPYVIKRVTSNIDALGYRPEHNDVRDVQGRVIPPQDYFTSDFERKLSIPERTRAFALHLLRHLFSTDPLGKTIVFCVDQQHALDMAKYVNEAFEKYREKYNFDYNYQYSTRITGNDKDSNGKYPMLEKFADLEGIEPIVVTTSKLLTTGIDVKTVKNIVLFRNIGSMVEFKQIIGRGTRTYDHIDKSREKLGFFILEYANFSTQLFQDPEWDDVPENVVDDGSINVAERPAANGGKADDPNPPVADKENSENLDAAGLYVERDADAESAIKFRMSEQFLRNQVKMVAESLSLTGPDGRPMTAEKFIVYQSELFRKQFPELSTFQDLWLDPQRRKRFVIEGAENPGVNLSYLESLFFEKHTRRGIDLFDVIAELFFQSGFLTKDQRIAKARELSPRAFSGQSATEAELIQDILAVYLENNFQPLLISSELWQTPRLAKHGSILEIQKKVNGQENLKRLLNDLQTALYQSGIAA